MEITGLPSDLNQLCLFYLDVNDYHALATSRAVLNIWIRKHSKCEIKAISFSKAWTVNDEYHRDDGPAIEYRFGEVWYKFGKLHREDGPAIIRHRSRGWYLDGHWIASADVERNMRIHIYLAKRRKIS
jgi:hypothetical protein